MKGDKFWFKKSDKYKFLYFQNMKVASSTLQVYFVKTIPNELFKGGHPYGIEEYDSKMYNDYFKFAFVRNPWSYVLSAWYNKIYDFKKPDNNPMIRLARKQKFSFKKFVKEIHSNKKFRNGHWIPQHEKFPHSDLNFIGKLENIQSDLYYICDKVGIPKQKLPHRNKSNHKHYTEYYDDETKQMVAEYYAKDIEHFGYKFEE